ncbi:MAG: D-alanine--D-alanine ligase [Acidobacteria bacterium]|nr:D-alanine--D-alanine ligase [Acidobacteriota bacterium]
MSTARNLTAATVSGTTVGAVTRLPLIVLFGGRSAEHDISRITARHVLGAIDPDRYRIDAIGIDHDGVWHRAEEALAALAAAALPEALVVDGPVVDPIEVLSTPDAVVLPLLHGPNGEDGTVQGLFEVTGVTYVGTGVLGSALAMDKVAAKHLADAMGFAQTRWMGVHRTDLDGDARRALLDDAVVRLGFPMFVKPANMGSSIGVSRATDRDALEVAVDEALRFDDWLVLEEGVTAREIEVAVLGHTTSARASVPGEIVPAAEFYDYDDKYNDGAAQLHIPADLPSDVADAVRALAVQVFRAYRAEGLARVDFLYEEQGRGLLLNELNTMPGFTPISMYPQLWQATGLTYRALIDELVTLAQERAAQRR